MFSPWRVEPSSMKAGLLTVKFERWVRQQPFYDYNIIRPPIQFMFILLLVAISRWFRSTGPAHIREPRGPSPINSPAPLFTRLHTSEEMEWNLVYVQLTFVYVYSFMPQTQIARTKPRYNMLWTLHNSLISNGAATWNPTNYSWIACVIAPAIVIVII